MRMFKQLKDEGTTIVRVIHSEKNASYGGRTIHLLDGRIEKKDDSLSMRNIILSSKLMKKFRKAFLLPPNYGSPLLDLQAWLT